LAKTHFEKTYLTSNGKVEVSEEGVKRLNAKQRTPKEGGTIKKEERMLHKVCRGRGDSRESREKIEK